MKALKMSCFFTLLILCFSCDLFFHQEPFIIHYRLIFSFQDVSGNDLVKGIGLMRWKPDSVPMEEAHYGYVDWSLLRLDVIFPEQCKDGGNRHFNSIDMLELRWERNDDYNTLQADFALEFDDCPNTKVLNYKINSPYIFGDYYIHNLVTYWEIPKKKDKYSNNRAKCYRIEFEGKVYTPIIDESSSRNTSVTIIYERREIQ